jgi:hypothetical protein
MSDISTESASNVASDVPSEVIQALSLCLSNATYACGGTVKIAGGTLLPKPSDAAKPSNGDQSLADPITIRWDSASSIEKLTLPITALYGETDYVAKLVAGTQALLPKHPGYSQGIRAELYRLNVSLKTSS